jgi:hypothetical protein
MIKTTIYLIAALFVVNCNNTSTSRDFQKAVNCLRSEFEQNSRRPIHSELKFRLIDSLNHWIYVDSVTDVQYLRTNPHKLNENILINDDSTKAVLFLLIINSSPNDDSAVFSKMIPVEKDSLGNWIFFMRGSTTFSFANAPDRKEPITFDDLSEFTVQNIIRDGYYLDGGCNKNKNYFIKSFDESRFRQQKGFLESKYPNEVYY